MESLVMARKMSDSPLCKLETIVTVVLVHIDFPGLRTPITFC